jgi:CheY-like chemotaxis protein
VILIIEDDEIFGRILLGLARDHDFRGVIASSGAQALELARSLQPHAITLDLRLPDMNGWVVLDQLKHDPAVRHIPVHVISAVDEVRRGMESGAIAFLRKPAEQSALDDALSDMQKFLERKLKRLLVVEADETQRAAIVDLLSHEDVETTAVGTGEAALAELERGAFDCMVLDLSLPGMSGIEVMNAVQERPAWRRLPIIVYGGTEGASPLDDWGRTSESMVVKGANSPERLVEEAALFLHRVEANLPPARRDMIKRSHQPDPALAGRKVLLVDDDARNLFAITTILEQHDMRIAYAENGQQALEKLQAERDFDIVLMDIMMPEMDGYEATRKIRSVSELARLPVIALTAKAMKGDREKCIEAGASDYITKPIDRDQLVSMLRVWLYDKAPSSRRTGEPARA